ncbi:MAG TPA: DUF6600 domain-containing protein [Thermoanaerobaculia bacterium]|nr:DUF6600 domain-containing protein [Thermoanaerobaculia bacterium]
MRVARSLFAAAWIGAVVAIAAPTRMDAAVAVSIGVFHDQLSPYGSWVVAGSYGNVWVPRVAAGWSPYVDGQWIYTDYGWTWESTDPWGGVPCHYGSWAWEAPYGWVWVPGTVWAPAWVTWAYGDDYVGWAPLPPSFAFSASGYAGAPVVVATTRYVFVPTRQFVGVPVASVRIPAANNAVIFPRTVKTTAYQVSAGIVRTAGPPPSRIERVAAHPIAPVSIDRVKTRPTTIEQAGLAKSARVAVVAPKAENARLGTTEARPAPNAPSARNAPPKPAVNGEKAEPPDKTAAHARPESAPERPPQAAQKSEPKAKKPAPAPRREARPKEKEEPPPPAAQARPPQQPPAEARKPEPRNETHVAGKGKPPAPPQHRPAPQAAPKPRPQPPPERKPEPESERPPG